MNKKILLSALLSVSALTGCVKDPIPTPAQTDQPSESVKAEYKPDYSKAVTLRLSVNYDKSKGMKADQAYQTPDGKTQINKGDYKPVWQELQKRLNFSIDDKTPTDKKAVDQFKADWLGETNPQYADLACGNTTDIVKNSVSGDKETILDLSQYLEYMPNFSKFLEENPVVELSITTSKHGDPSKYGIYYVPYFDGFNDLEKMTLVRADYVRKLLDATSFDNFDTDPGILPVSSYQSECEKGEYKVTVANADATTRVVTKAAVSKGIIERQNELMANNTDTGKALAEQFVAYIQERYGSQFTKLSDLFLGTDSCYDADEMVALMRVVRANPKLLTGKDGAEVVPFVPRQNNNQRIADLYRWGGQLWGVRGVESRQGYLYVDKDNQIQDARGDEEMVALIENLNELYKEGLILKNFHQAAGYGTDKGAFAESIVVGGNEKYSGFMEYDYSQTQGVWNDRDGSKAIEGYDFRPILGGVAYWDDGDDSTGYFHFTESWRSVKTQGWCLNASLADEGNEDKLMRALALADYFYSDEGHALQSYGPESMGYTKGTMNYQGREIPKFTPEALEQLKTLGKGSYTDYLRIFVGATLPIGYVKEQGMEYQCTSENAKNGLAIINTAIEAGTYKHVECAIMENGFYTIVPSAFVLTEGQASQINDLEKADKLGSINSKSSDKSWNIWDDYVMYGFGATVDGTTLLTKEGYLNKVNTEWTLGTIVKIYNDRFQAL